MTQIAYRVPFVVDRSRAPHRYRLVNRSTEPLDAVHIMVLRSGATLPMNTRRLPPGKALNFAGSGHRPGHAALFDIVIVRWFRPNGEEYLWRVVL
ncbi:MAG: hypothetical protein JWM51_841 [Microbacteriaceae bacterium]|jgi:hypothetical protein|nr:hypothetical protein [Microbacteriaceae bacterium]